MIADLIEQAASHDIGYRVLLNIHEGEYVGYSVELVRRSDKRILQTIDVTGFMAFLIPTTAPMSPTDLELIQVFEDTVEWTRDRMVRMEVQARAWRDAGRPRAG